MTNTIFYNGLQWENQRTAFKAIPHNSKCRYGERGAAAAKPKAQIILDAAKVSAASGGNSEPKQGQRSQSARGFCPRSTMRVPQPDIIEHFGNADAVPQPPERRLSRQAGIVRCCPNSFRKSDTHRPMVFAISWWASVVLVYNSLMVAVMGCMRIRLTGLYTASTTAASTTTTITARQPHGTCHAAPK